MSRDSPVDAGLLTRLRGTVQERG